MYWHPLTHKQTKHLNGGICSVLIHCFCLIQIIYHITKTYLYNFDPLKAYFYIVKLGFIGVYIIFLISDQKHRLWVLVRTAWPRRFLRVPTIYVLSRNMKNIRVFYLKIFSIWRWNRHVFVMIQQTQTKNNISDDDAETHIYIRIVTTDLAYVRLYYSLVCRIVNTTNTNRTKWHKNKNLHKAFQQHKRRKKTTDLHDFVYSGPVGRKAFWA